MGQIDEDPIEAFDNDNDGLIDEDGPDPQIDNDGDGLWRRWDLLRLRR